MEHTVGIVNTKSGRIRGKQRIALFGQEYWSFEGIPYAQSPIGNLRFRAPKPVLPWSDVLDADQQGPACCNIDPALGALMSGDENCLHLNIYLSLKAKNEEKLLPVLVFLHGGAFMFGSSDKELYGPDYFMTQSIVLVTLNYRIGAFGFLSLDTLDVPGNAGLKDQRMALKWIQNNIDAFNGDPSNVTLCGESAGACSAHFHLLSKNSRHLFQRAILMSGCALNPWSIVDSKLNMGQRLAMRLGWQPSSNETILQFLQTCAAEDITKEQHNLLTETEAQRHVLYPFGPVVEHFDDDDCVITTPPIEMCQNEHAWSYVAKVPVLVLGTSEEGLYFRKAVVDKKNTNVQDYIKNLVPSCRNIINENITRAFQDFYFKSEEISSDNLVPYIDFMSDRWFWHGLHRTIRGRMARNSGPTYVLRFSVDLGAFNHFKTLMCGTDVKGTCHVDNCSYLFRPQCVRQDEIAIKEANVINIMVEIFKSFAENGIPKVEFSNELSISWTDHDGFYKCLNICNEGSKLIELPEKTRMQFWDRFYDIESLF